MVEYPQKCMRNQHWQDFSLVFLFPTIPPLILDTVYIYEFYLVPSSVSKQCSINLVPVQSYVLNLMNKSYIVQMLVSNDIFSKGSQCFCGIRILLKFIYPDWVIGLYAYLDGLDCWICFLGIHGLQYASSGWIIGLGNMSRVKFFHSLRMSK